MEQKREDLERTVTIEFKGVQLVNYSFAEEDLKLLFAETFQVHPSQIQVTVFFPIQNNTFRRRNAAPLSATIELAMLTNTPILAFAGQVASLPSPFAGSTYIIQENVKTGGSMPLGLIVGLSVGAIVLVIGLVALFRHFNSRQTVGFHALPPFRYDP